MRQRLETTTRAKNIREMCKRENDEVSARGADISKILEISGKYQIWQYVLACLPAVFVSMLNINFVFVAGDVNYRCRVSECEAADSVYSPEWWPRGLTDRCSRPVVNSTALARGTVGGCTGASFTDAHDNCNDWVYESDNTIVAEFDLGCQPWKIDFVGTIHGVGTIVAMIASGWMCDRFGRKPTLIVCAVACVIGNLKVLAKSYNLYIFLEFMEGALTQGAYTAGSVIMSETSTNKTRVAAGVMFAYAIYMGEVVLAGVAMYVQYWKHLLYIICTPPILFLSYIYLLNESPRWQILHSKMKDARKILKRIVKTNKLKISIQEIDQINDVELKNYFNLDKSENKEGLREMFKSKEIIKRLIAGIVWRLAVSFIYYSLVVNSVMLPGDKHTNFLLTALTSFPGELISMCLMNTIGRRVPLMSGFLLSGITCAATAFVTENCKWIKITLFLIGKLVVSACYTGSVVYSMELFPTSVRGVCVSLCTLASCAGSMLAPFTPTLTKMSPIYASICYATFAILATALLLVTPETKGTPLMDTIEQVNSTVLKNLKLKHSNNPGLQRFKFKNDEFSSV